MRRDAKGPRLWFRAKPAPGEWVIKDYPHQRRTGCGYEQRREAEAALERYLAEKRRQDGSPRNPDLIPVATVLQDYLDEVAPQHARPRETAARITFLLPFFGRMMLGDITGKVCRDYVASRSTTAMAGRELQDLRAAIRHHWKEGRATYETKVVLPKPSRPRERWLTRNEVARLLWAAYRNRQEPHIARFILIALYTGSRTGVILEAVYGRSLGGASFDLEGGTFLRSGPGHRETRKRRPPAPISRRLLAHLRRWKRMARRSSYAVEYRGERLGTIGQGFAICAEEAGLKGVTPHVLRHTAATWLMQAGEDPWKAAGLLGMTVKTLLDTYGHHHPEHQAGAAEALAKGGRRA